ncbi:MAG: hypothetical protein LBU91_08555 [Bacteroidales bacterium]|jgi:uncharacterized protein (TIGR02145 family)|nr:hypothetical protein [Bacteroidales bacterium]
MTEKFFKMGRVVAMATCLAAAAMFTACDKDDENKDKGGDETTTVNFVSLDASIVSEGSARLYVELDEQVWLMTKDVTTNVGEVTMAQNGSGDGKNWTIYVSGLSASQEITITLKKDKYTFEPSSRKITVNGNSDDDTDNPEDNLTIGDMIWATTNVDGFQTFAEMPDMYTKFYQWNRNKAWSEVGLVSEWSETGITDTAWTINPCPDGWRLPTQDEFKALHNAGNSWAAANARGNAVAGRFYGENHATASLPDNMDGCIFLPALGYRNNVTGALQNRNSYGYYWSSDRSNETEGYKLDFDNTNSSPDFGGKKSNGYSVRCVQNVE